MIERVAIALKFREARGLDIGDIFKSLIWDALVTAALNALFKAVPFLAWGPLGVVVSIIVRYVADWIFEGVDEYIDLQAIAFKKLELAREYAKYCVELKRVALVSGIDSVEFKNAREAAKLGLRDFIKFNG